MSKSLPATRHTAKTTAVTNSPHLVPAPPPYTRRGRCCSRSRHTRRQGGYWRRQGERTCKHRSARFSVFVRSWLVMQHPATAFALRLFTTTPLAVSAGIYLLLTGELWTTLAQATAVPARRPRPPVVAAGAIAVLEGVFYRAVAASRTPVGIVQIILCIAVCALVAWMVRRGGGGAV